MSLGNVGYVIVNSKVSTLHVMMKVFVHTSLPCRWRQTGPPKLWYPTALLHGVRKIVDHDLNFHRREILISRTKNLYIRTVNDQVIL